MYIILLLEMFTLIQTPFYLSFQLNQEIQVKNNEAQRESRKKDKMERELKQAKADLDAKTGEIKNLQGRVENYKGDISKLEQQMKEQKVGYLAYNNVTDSRMDELFHAWFRC